MGHKLDSGIVALVVFGLVQAGSLLWALATLKGDARVVNAQLSAMQREIEAQGRVLERQSKMMEEISDQRREVALIQERQLLQGRRIDGIERRLNTLTDKPDEDQQTP